MNHKDYFDSNFDLFVYLANDLKKNYPAKEMWVGSPFEWIQTLHSKQIGTVGEILVSNWCIERGFEVKRALNSDADRIINGHRVEIKYSSLWGNKTYTFQQLRNQDYDYYFWIGVSPHNIHAWFIPKDVILPDVPRGVTPQHNGSAGTDTWWIKNLDPLNVPDWLQPYGGSLDEVEKIIKKMPKGAYVGR